MSTPPAETGSRLPGAWEAWSPLAGVVAVVLWVVGLLLDPGIPDLFEADGDEWLRFVTDNESGILLSRLLFLLGYVALFVFLGALRASLVAVEGEPRRWTAVAFGAGVAMTALLIMSTTPVAAAAASDGIEPAAAQALGIAEYAFFLGAEFAGAALLATTGLLALRVGVLPAWLGWATLVLAVFMVLPIGPVGFIALVVGFPLWVLATSVLLWRGRIPR
jgi:hypothetical protein